MQWKGSWTGAVDPSRPSPPGQLIHCTVKAPCHPCRKRWPVYGGKWECTCALDFWCWVWAVTVVHCPWESGPCVSLCRCSLDVLKAFIFAFVFSKQSPVRRWRVHWGAWSLGLGTVLPPPYLCFSVPCSPFLGTSGSANLPIPAPTHCLLLPSSPVWGWVWARGGLC